MEIAVRLVGHFTSAWHGELDLDLLVVSLAGEVAPFLLSRCRHCGGQGLGRGWHQQSPCIACYSCGFDFLLCV